MDSLSRRQVVIPVSSVLLQQILRFPEGIEARGVHPAVQFDGFVVVARSALFEEVEDGVELPRMTVQYHTCEACGGPVFDELYPIGPFNTNGRISW